jgi:hypothetical protein
MPIISASIKTFKLTKMPSRENHEIVKKDSYLFLEVHLEHSRSGSTTVTQNDFVAT